MLDTANHTRVVVPVALRALEAQRLVDLIAFKVNPAVAAGLIAYAHIGELGSSVLWSRRRCSARCSSSSAPPCRWG